MKKIDIKFYIILILSLIGSRLCFGHDLAELINKCDFVKFKQAYQESNLNEKEKTKFLNQIDQIISECLKKLMVYSNQPPKQKEGKQLKIVRTFMAGITGVFFGIGLIPLSFAYDTLQRKKNVPSKYNRTAASFAGRNSIQRFALYMNQKDSEISYLNSDYWATIAVSIVISSLGGLYFLLYKWLGNCLIIYKRWKKALKIKKLIEESMTNESIEAIVNQGI